MATTDGLGGVGAGVLRAELGNAMSPAISRGAMFASSQTDVPQHRVRQRVRMSLEDTSAQHDKDNDDDGDSETDKPSTSRSCRCFDPDRRGEPVDPESDPPDKNDAVNAATNDHLAAAGPSARQ
jgi:hypothetical protein